MCLTAGSEALGAHLNFGMYLIELSAFEFKVPIKS